MTLTRRGLVAVATGAFLIVAAASSGAAVLLLAGAVALAAVGVSAAFAARDLGGLTVRRTLPATSVAGNDLPVRLEVRGGTFPFAILRDVCALGPDRRVSLIPVGTGSGAEPGAAGYTVPLRRRGLCRFGDVAAESTAPFGLVRARRSLRAPGSVVVYPRVVRVRGWPDISGRRHSGIGPESPDRRGATHEFFAAREYRPGDPARHLHPRLTARTGKLIVREFQATSSGEVELVPDLCRHSYADAAGVNALDDVITLTASLARALLRGGVFVRLWLAGSRTRMIPPGAGEEHARRILQELALAEADGDRQPSVALSRLAPAFTPGATVVSVMRFRGRPHLAGPVAALRRSGRRFWLVQLGGDSPPDFAHDAFWRLPAGTPPDPLDLAAFRLRPGRAPAR